MHRRLSSWARTSDRGNVSVGPVGKRPWLDGYAGQTTDELIGLADTYRIDSVVLAFEEALAAKAERLGTASLTPAERVVLVVEAVEREVNNDGIDGLFFNSSKVYAPDFVSALGAIGRHDVADLIQRAINALGLAASLSVEAIDLALEQDDAARDEKLAELAERYYELAGDLAPDLLSFINANREEIVLRS
jgi:hypothetical protein